MQPAANRSQSLFLALLAGLVAASLAACSSATSPLSNGGGEGETASAEEGKHDSFMAQNKSDGLYDVDPGSAEAEGVLELVNTASFEVLDDDVSLDVRAAENIVEARQKSEIATLKELDAIPWVGPRAFGKLYEYAQANGYVGDDPKAETIHGVVVESPKARAILEVANRAPRLKLDATVELDSRAADAIVEYRTEGADDLSIDSLTELAGISWVAEEAFGNLGAYVEANDLVPAEIAGIIEGTYEALAVVELANESSREKLDVEVGLDARAADNIVTYRNDEGSIESLTELDGIYWVGTSAIESLLAHAESSGSVPACGDGTTDPIEACDDGNLENGDGCSAACVVEVVTETNDDDNDERAGAEKLGDHTFARGTFIAETTDGRDVDYWTFTLERETYLRVDYWGGHAGLGKEKIACRTVLAKSGDTYDHVSFHSAFEVIEAGEEYGEGVRSDCGTKRSEELGGDGRFDRSFLLQPGTYYIEVTMPSEDWPERFLPMEIEYGFELVREPTP